MSDLLEATGTAIDRDELVQLVFDLCNSPSPIGTGGESGQFVFDWMACEGFARRKAVLAPIEELVAFITQDRFICRHKWQAGDVLVWDNRCTLHTGTLYDDTKYDRLMHRLRAKGDRAKTSKQSFFEKKD